MTGATLAMSRAFVTDKEAWAYCPKAGERCMYAEYDSDCRRTSCEHYGKKAASASAGPSDASGASGSAGASGASGQTSLRTVRRAERSDGPAGQKSAGPAGSKASGPAKTKRAKLAMPRRWGGRSGNNF